METVPGLEASSDDSSQHSAHPHESSSPSTSRMEGSVQASPESARSAARLSMLAALDRVLPSESAHKAPLPQLELEPVDSFECDKADWTVTPPGSVEREPATQPSPSLPTEPLVEDQPILVPTPNVSPIKVQVSVQKASPPVGVKSSASAFSDPSSGTDVVANLSMISALKKPRRRRSASKSRRKESSSKRSSSRKNRGKKKKQVRVRYADDYLEDEEEEDSYSDYSSDSYISAEEEVEADTSLVKAFFDFLMNDEQNDDESLGTLGSESIGTAPSQYSARAPSTTTTVTANKADTSMMDEEVTKEERAPKKSSSLVGLLGEILKSCSCDPFCDNKYYTDYLAQKEKEGEMTDAETVEGQDTEKANVLDFDATFFKELWKEMGAAKANVTDQTAFPKFDLWGAMQNVMPPETVSQHELSKKQHAEVLSSMFRPGGVGGSAKAKKKADLILKQCKEKFPSLYTRLVSRLDVESKRNTLWRSQQKESMPAVDEHDDGSNEEKKGDDDDSVLQESICTAEDAATSSEKANQTPRIANRCRSVSPEDIDAFVKEEEAAHDATPPVKENKSEAGASEDRRYSTECFEAGEDSPSKKSNRRPLFKISMGSKKWLQARGSPRSRGTAVDQSPATEMEMSEASATSKGTPLEQKLGRGSSHSVPGANAHNHDDDTADASSSSYDMSHILTDLADAAKDLNTHRPASTHSLSVSSTSREGSPLDTENTTELDTTRKHPTRWDRYTTPVKLGTPNRDRPGKSWKGTGLAKELFSTSGELPSNWEKFPTPPRDTFRPSNADTAEPQAGKPPKRPESSNASLLPASSLGRSASEPLQGAATEHVSTPPIEPTPIQTESSSTKDEWVRFPAPTKTSFLSGPAEESKHTQPPLRAVTTPSASEQVVLAQAQTPRDVLGEPQELFGLSLDDSDEGWVQFPTPPQGAFRTEGLKPNAGKITKLAAPPKDTYRAPSTIRRAVSVPKERLDCETGKDAEVESEPVETKRASSNLKTRVSSLEPAAVVSKDSSVTDKSKVKIIQPSRKDSPPIFNKKREWQSITPLVKFDGPKLREPTEEVDVSGTGTKSPLSGPSPTSVAGAQSGTRVVSDLYPPSALDFDKFE